MSEKKLLTPSEAFGHFKAVREDLNYIFNDQVGVVGWSCNNGYTSCFSTSNVDWGDLKRFPPKEKKKVWLKAEDLPHIFVVSDKDYSNTNAISLVLHKTEKHFCCHVGDGSIKVIKFSNHKELKNLKWSEFDVLDWREFYTDK